MRLFHNTYLAWWAGLGSLVFALVTIWPEWNSSPINPPGIYSDPSLSFGARHSVRVVDDSTVVEHFFDPQQNAMIRYLYKHDKLERVDAVVYDSLGFEVPLFRIRIPIGETYYAKYLEERRNKVPGNTPPPGK